jgi:hypothetical protein
MIVWFALIGWTAIVLFIAWRLRHWARGEQDPDSWL